MKCPNCGEKLRSKRRDYEYRESGLRNVVLRNIAVYECQRCGEELPEIPNVKRVHEWIAEYLVSKTAPLSGEEFRFLRETLGYKAKELASLLGVSRITVSRWENNREKIGPQSDRLLRLIYLTKAKGFASPIDIISHIARTRLRSKPIFIPFKGRRPLEPRELGA